MAHTALVPLLAYSLKSVRHGGCSESPVCLPDVKYDSDSDDSENKAICDRLSISQQFSQPVLTQRRPRAP